MTDSHIPQRSNAQLPIIDTGSVQASQALAGPGGLGVCMSLLNALSVERILHNLCLRLTMAVRSC